jgi:glycosyltransferase involved in cell wall biosynthesis
MFSVVIPIYNHAMFIAQAVRSALRCPLVDEVLLLDDGSSDGSAEIAARLAAAHRGRLRNVTPTDGRNRGAHYRLNELVGLAEQQWIAVLNSDDIFVPGRFEAVVQDPGFSKCDFAFGNVLLIDDRGSLKGAKLGPFDFGLYQHGQPDSNRLMALLCLENFVVSTSNMIFRKALHIHVRGFSPFRYVHDWDFALRAMALGRSLYVRRFLTAYRVHSRNTIKEKKEGVDLEITTMLDRFLFEFPGVITRDR